MTPFKHVKADHLVFEVVLVFLIFESVVSLDEEMLRDKETPVGDDVSLSHFEALEWVFQPHYILKF